jgi:thiosulfate/3-mercaptopyruvate sulfurtransferase
MSSTIVSSAELAAHPEWRVFDCRHELSAPARGRVAWRQAHIPGALHAHLDEDLSGPKTAGSGRHPLPSVQAFTAWLGRCGVRPQDQIVAYDDSAGSMAVRLWWMLRWIGHEQAAVLDGGLQSWVREGRALTAEVAQFPPTQYRARARDDMRVDTRAVEENLESQRFQLIDARGARRYAGLEEPIDPVAGHIPGAVNRPYSANLTADGFFKSSLALRSEISRLIGARAASEIVHHCGSGVSACHNVLAMEIAGLCGSRLYPGSWSEWSSSSGRPVAVGST